jgi:hypothetical protein
MTFQIESEPARGAPERQWEQNGEQNACLHTVHHSKGLHRRPTAPRATSRYRLLGAPDGVEPVHKSTAANGRERLRAMNRLERI